MNCDPGFATKPTTGCLFAEAPLYEVGDVVNLNVGGPDMTVLDYCADCGTVDVCWFNGDSLEIASLPEEVLV